MHFQKLRAYSFVCCKSIYISSFFQWRNKSYFVYFPVCKCSILYLKSCTSILINVRLLWICLCIRECDQCVQFSWLLDLYRFFLTCSLKAQEFLLRKCNLYRSYAKIDYLIQNSICLHLKTYFIRFKSLYSLFTTRSTYQRKPPTVTICWTEGLYFVYN